MKINCREWVGGKMVYQSTKKRASGLKCHVTGKRIQGVCVFHFCIQFGIRFYILVLPFILLLACNKFFIIFGSINPLVKKIVNLDYLGNLLQWQCSSLGDWTL